MDEDEPNPEPSNTAESLQPSYAPWSPTWATASTTDTDEEINDPHVDQVNDLPTGDTIYFGVNNLHDIIPVELPADSPLLTAEHHELVNAVLKIHYEMLRAQSHANAWDVLGGEVHRISGYRKYPTGITEPSLPSWEAQYYCEGPAGGAYIYGPTLAQHDDRKHPYKRLITEFRKIMKAREYEDPAVTVEFDLEGQQMGYAPGGKLPGYTRHNHGLNSKVEY